MQSVDRMEPIRPDEQQANETIDEIDAASSSAPSSASSLVHSTSGGARRPHWRTHGVPIRVRDSGDALSVAASQTPSARAERVLLRLMRTAFLNRNFALLWWGQAISSVGDYVWDTALVLWIATSVAAKQSWAPLAVSAAILSAMLPQIVVGPIAGVFVDRWNKRRTMIVAAAIQTALAALLIIPVVGLPGIGLQRLPSLWLLGVVCLDIVLLTSCAQFFLPAQLALIKDIVARPKQDQAIEMTQAIQGLAVVLGPPLAAALVFGLGIQWALLLNALTFAHCVVATVAIAAPPATSSLSPGETGHFSREFVAGARYVLRHTILRTILIAEILTWLGFGALQSLGYFFIAQDLRGSPSDYGFFAASFGLGAICGGALVMTLGRRIGLARLLWIALVTAGAFIVVMSHLRNLDLALGAAFFFGAASTAILVSAGPLATDATEKAFVGRVTAVLNPVGRLAALVSVILAGSLVGTVLSGFHAEILGVGFDAIKAIFTVAGLLAIAGGLYTRKNLRHLIQRGSLASGPESTSKDRDHPRPAWSECARQESG